MSLIVREAGPEDYAAVTACMRTVFEETEGRKLEEFGDTLWRWQYLAGPRGAVVVLAEWDGEVCGYYHCVLLDFDFLGSRVLAAMIQDVGTLASHRRKGIFKAMGAHALELLRGRGVRLAYSFPNSRSMPSFVRNHGYHEVARAPMYVLPMNLGAWALRRAPRGLAKLAGTLRGRRRKDHAHSATRIERFGAEADELCALTQDAVGARLARTASFLNWRFLDKPSGNYEAWGAWDGRRLRAYAVFARAELFSADCTVLVDGLCSPTDRDALVQLCRERLRVLAQEGVTLAVSMAVGDPISGMLDAAGFVRVPRRLDPRPFHVLYKDVLHPDRYPPFSSQWQLTLADWDVL